MNFFLKTLDFWAFKVLETFKRFPLSIFSSFTVTILLIILIEVGNQAVPAFILIANKLILVLTLGILLFPALHLLSKRRWFKAGGILILSLYYLYLPYDVLDSMVIANHILLILALSFMFLWAPFMDIKISNQNIWEWTQTIFQNLLVSLLLSLVIFFIFYLTMYALERLFSLTIEVYRYTEFLILVLGLFGVSYFLGKMPKYIMLVQKNQYGEVGLVFTKYILTSSFLIYFLILFAYIFKVVLNGTYAKVNMDLLIVGYVIIAIGTYIHWTPLWHEPNRKFRLFLWGSNFLLSLILASSLYLRTLSSSLEEYYLISLFTLWLGLISLYFLLFKEASYKWLFFSLSLLIVISQSEQFLEISLEFYEKRSKLFLENYL